MDRLKTLPYRCFLLLYLFVLPFFGKAQLVESTQDPFDKQNLAESFESQAVKTNFVRSAGEVGLVQFIPWTYSYFITEADFSRISFKSIGKNTKLSSWEWDDDSFTTNQFAHPFHGSLYYNAFRSNGYDVLPASLATISGSLIWEIAGENQNPSKNDLVNTTFGGVILGEMAHRLARKLTNNNSIGFRRQANEVVSMFINPMSGFNRILDGKWGKQVYRNQQPDSSKLNAQLDFGLRRIGINSRKVVRKGSNVPYGRMRFTYEENRKHKKPLDAFSVDVELGLDDSAFVNALSVYGLLYAKDLVDTYCANHRAILSANYDLLHNSAFFFGGQSVNINLLSKFNISNPFKVNTTVKTGVILLAAIPNPYISDLYTRRYDYASGLNLGGAISLIWLEKVELGMNYMAGMVSSISGGNSKYLLQALSTELSIIPLKPFSIHISSGDFVVRGIYRDYVNTKKSYTFGRLSLGLQLFF